MNPEQRRLIFAFAAIVIVMFIWSMMTMSNSKRVKPAPDTAVPTDTVRPDTSGTSVKGRTGEVVVSDTIVIDRDAYRLVLTSAGASVLEFYLKEYRINIVPENEYLFISEDPQGRAVAFKPLVTADSAVFIHESGTVVVRKVYHFDKPDGFSLNVGAFDARSGASLASDTLASVLDLRGGVRITEERNRGDDLRYFGVHVKTDRVISITKDIKDELDYQPKWQWVGLRNKYFMLCVRNLGTVERTTFFKLVPPAAPVKKAAAGFGCAFMQSPSNVYGLNLVSRPGFELCVVLLPLKDSELAKYGQGFEKVIHGGIWGPISKVILLFFNLVYRLFHNYGVAIIIFALLLKAIFFPLSRQMIISQHKMQMLQPEMKKVQAKYKNDPQALNQEMMHLYKTYKVNPFSGCLPLLIQMPIFFALYQALGTSIEFRQAPFVFWLTDLSLKDPYYILPIGMGVMMLVQSLMTTVDPRQRMLVFLMPVFMIFIFLNLPSGLQLYWFTYNILTLIEHYITKKGGIR